MKWSRGVDPVVGEMRWFRRFAFWPITIKGYKVFLEFYLERCVWALDAKRKLVSRSIYIQETCKPGWKTISRYTYPLSEKELAEVERLKKVDAEGNKSLFNIQA